VPDWVRSRLKEIAAIDLDSSASRYAEGRIAGEIYVSISYLKQVMAALHVAFYSVTHGGMFPTSLLDRDLELDYGSI
jgi:hypothetical protein